MLLQTEIQCEETTFNHHKLYLGQLTVHVHTSTGRHIGVGAREENERRSKFCKLRCASMHWCSYAKPFRVLRVPRC